VREEGRGFFQDVALFLQPPVLTAQTPELRALITFELALLLGLGAELVMPSRQRARADPSSLATCSSDLSELR
jgi:hypothetical protein